MEESRIFRFALCYLFHASRDLTNQRRTSPRSKRRANWQTLCDFHRWHRWWRQEAQNRSGPEPKYCTAFVENKTWYKPVRIHGIDGYKVYPKTILDQGVIEWYQSARMPQPEPVQPFDSETKTRIESLYQKVRTHFTE